MQHIMLHGLTKPYCILLFSIFVVANSMNVNVQVFYFWGLRKIATRYLMPELAGARLTPKLCSHVADEFVNKYGKYAGWAQTILFIAELPSQKVLLPPYSRTQKERKFSKKKDGDKDGDY